MNSTKHLLHPELQVMAETKIIGEINDENLIKVRKTLDDLKPELTDAERAAGKYYAWNETNYNSNPATAWVLT